MNVKRITMWRPEEEVALKQYTKEGMSVAEIANILHRPEGGVYQRIQYLSRIGVIDKKEVKKKRKVVKKNEKKKNKRWTKEDDMKLYELVKQGKSYKKISRELRRTENAVRNRWRRNYETIYGIKRNIRKVKVIKPPKKIEKSSLMKEVLLPIILTGMVCLSIVTIVYMYLGR